MFRVLIERDAISSNLAQKHIIYLFFNHLCYSFPPSPGFRRAAGGVAASLTVLPPEPTSFLEQNRAGITMMFGVIIASGVVKFLRCVSSFGKSGPVRLQSWNRQRHWYLFFFLFLIRLQGGDRKKIRHPTKFSET